MFYARPGTGGGRLALSVHDTETRVQFSCNLSGKTLINAGNLRKIGYGYRNPTRFHRYSGASCASAQRQGHLRRAGRAGQPVALGHVAARQAPGRSRHHRQLRRLAQARTRGPGPDGVSERPAGEIHRHSQAQPHGQLSLCRAGLARSGGMQRPDRRNGLFIVRGGGRHGALLALCHGHPAAPPQRAGLQDQLCAGSRQAYDGATSVGRA